MSSLVNESPSKKSRTSEGESAKNCLEQLKAYTVVVADTGEFAAIKQFTPQDATTNPSLIYKAAMLPQYEELVQGAIKYGDEHAAGKSAEEKLNLTMDKLAVNFGVEISKQVPGYVSTEVDARLSFDTEETVKRARGIISMYKEMGVDKSRILIKIASTYEGIRAGEILQKEGITCNLTLLFSLVQAAACAEAGITLISPFVGRILDWHKAKTGNTFTAETDPGVLSVKQIYRYFKKFNYSTIIMGASFRNIGEITALAGCDRLTIAPALLDELKKSHAHMDRQLEPASSAAQFDGGKIAVDERAFRWALNEDAMATEKLAEGIRSFAADLVKLENFINKKIEGK